MDPIPHTTARSLNVQALVDAALSNYTKHTGIDLRGHPLAIMIDRSVSLDAILAIFQEQSQAFNEFTNNDNRLIRRLPRVVDVLHALSTVISAGASIAPSPANINFSAIGVLLSTAMYVRESYETIVYILESIEHFLHRVKIYQEIQPTPSMTEIVVKIMVELLYVLALATKQISQGRLKKFATKLVGNNDIESVIQRLDRLTLDESRLTAFQTLNMVHSLIHNVGLVSEEPPPTIPAPSTTLSRVGLPPAHMSHTLSPLVLSNTVLGRGSHGTVVYQGTFQGRAVAVKRLIRDHVTLAEREINHLKRADDHPNVIRYFYQAADENFLYVVLALCPASLADIIERSDQFREIADSFNPKRAVREITSGLGHLHSLSLVHRDIKPSNILISSTKVGDLSMNRMLISDFGISRELEFDQTSYAPTVSGVIGAGTWGWKAPEILHREARASTGNNVRTTNATEMQTIRLTKSVDIFTLGCLYYYCLTTGGHPFGDHHDRDYNIRHGRMSLQDLESLGEDGPEAVDIITSMLAPEAADRPQAPECLIHPYFWDPGRRLEFLQDASDYFEAFRRNQQDPILAELESKAIDVVGRDWSQRLDKILFTHAEKRRKYKKESVQDLLRVVRNQKHHYQDLPMDVKAVVGPLPEGYLSYFTSRFPSLFLHVFSVIINSYLRQDDMFSSYFDPIC